MKKTMLILLALLWLSGVFLLIVALTGLFPGNPFKPYRLVIAFGFIAMTGFIKRAFRKPVTKV